MDRELASTPIAPWRAYLTCAESTDALLGEALGQCRATRTR
jgi:hypothetical protein